MSPTAPASGTIPGNEFFLADLSMEISLDRYLNSKADAQDLQDLVVNLVLAQEIDDKCFHSMNSQVLNDARQALLERIVVPNIMVGAMTVRYHHLRNITRWQFAQAVDFLEAYFGV